MITLDTYNELVTQIIKDRYEMASEGECFLYSSARNDEG